MMKKILMVTLMMVASLSVSAQNEAVNNQTVLDLLKEGFSSEEIIGAIENSTTRTITFDINFMRLLKTAGADKDLTTYLQKIAKTDMGYEGVVLWNPAGGKPEKIYRTNFEKESKGFNLGTLAVAAGAAYGIGSAVSGRKVKGGEAAAVSGGLVLMASTGKDIQKLVIPGTKAKVTTGRQPVFRFFFNGKSEGKSFESDAANWYEMVMNGIQSPNEFQLIKMQVKDSKKGGRRLFPSSMSYTIAGFEGTNASTREMINFEITTINNNTFEVSFKEPLEPGEYCFFYKSGLNNKYFQAQPFGFDFSVE